MLKRFLALLSALLCLTWGSPSWAAFGTPYEIATPVSYTSTGLTKTLVTNVSVAANDTIVISTYFNHATNNISSISDNSGDSVAWTSGTQYNSSLNRLRMFTKKLTNGGWGAGVTITITYSGSSSAQKTIEGIAFSGADVIDKNLTGSQGTSTSPAIALGTLTNAPQMVVLHLVTVDTAAPVTEPGGFDLISGQTATSRIAQLSAGVEATTTPSDPTYTMTSATWALQAMSFTEAAVTTTAPKRSLMGVGQ